MFKYSVKTMGCKANIYDSLLLERELSELGGVRALAKESDVFVLNSCTVTAEADRQTHREVNQLKQGNPNAWTIVTGCYAETGRTKLEGDPNIDAVIGNSASEKRKLREEVARRFSLKIPERPTEDFEIYWGQLPSFAGKTRAFLKIQEGCNDYCTYCIIPYGRGASRSVPLELVISEAERLAISGVKEIVITGTNIADYGLEFGSSLEDLIEAILLRTRIPRLRLTSLDPSEITDRILNLMHPGSRLMPHVHVSLQSPVSRVLRAMKRKYRTEEVISALERIYKKSSEIFVGMDIIAGFPGETLAEHEEGLAVLRSLPWTRLHVFPYSERKGTPAIKIPGSVPGPERKRRAQELMLLSKDRHQKFSERLLGETLHGVLFETAHEWGEGSESATLVTGHAENYLRVVARVPAGVQAPVNEIRSVKIEAAQPKPAQDWTLEGCLIDSVAPGPRLGEMPHIIH